MPQGGKRAASKGLKSGSAAKGISSQGGVSSRNPPPKGMARATDAGRSDATTRSRTKLAAGIRRVVKPAEKLVRETDQTLPVAPPTQGRAARKPMKVVAVDQR